MRKLIVVVLAAVFLAGCNTVSGFGKDIEQAGEALDRAATKRR